MPRSWLAQLLPHFGIPSSPRPAPPVRRSNASQPRPALSIATRLCQQQPHWGTHTPPAFVRVSLPSPWPPLLFAASKKSVIPSTIHPTPLDLICAWLPFIAHVVVTPPIHSFVHSFAHFSRFLSFSPSFAFESAAICNFATMMFSFPTNKQRGRKKGKKKNDKQQGGRSGPANRSCVVFCCVIEQSAASSSSTHHARNHHHHLFFTLPLSYRRNTHIIKNKNKN